MITTTYEYSAGTSFNYDSTKITFSDGTAKLLLTGNPGQTFTPVISASSYTGSLLTYAGGALKQVDQRPATATYYAAWSTQLNANWSGLGGGSLVITAANGAVINGSKLDLTGSTNRYVTFNATNNTDTLEQGTIEFQVTPNYAGAPSSDQTFLNISAAANSSNNLIDIDHFTDGRIYVDFYPSTGGDFALELSHGFNPTLGQTYTILIQFNATAGTASMYIDGTLVDSEFSDPWVRSGAIAYGVIGNNYNNADSNANFSISNFSYYSTVLTPASSTLSATIYPLATAILPEFTYAGLGAVVAFTSISITDVNEIGYTLNGSYWNGSAWVSSDGSYAQSVSSVVAGMHIGSLSASNTLQVNAIYPPGANQATLSTLTATYTGQDYSTVGPTITPNSSLSLDSVSNFVAVLTHPGSTFVNFYFLIGATNYWWNGTAWATSNGTHAQSNIPSDIVANLATLPVSNGEFVSPVALLYSPDGSETPSLESLAITYNFFGPVPPGPNVCTVFGYIVDESNNAVQGAIVTVVNSQTFINQGVVIAQGLYSVTTNSEGYFAISLVETASLSVPFTYKFSVVYPYVVSQNIGTPANNFSFGNAVVPNSPEANFAALNFA